ncbi:transposase [Ferrimonas aestuarii]|uniref:Transposase n=1 Tax=Ferrimonas aestuarii TaxID=2569539 RepID=A0A4U1BSH4_9GAMM|nr:transposase [Ferrimonas aestuarii]TKB58356.1 transposase [Ferrimonas aestuarii]
MPKARKQQVSLEDTRYYHCVSRCVRRAYLCSKDPYTGQSYEHRREWVQNRLLSLTQVFAVEVLAFAVMSNHTHVVLYVNTDAAKSWSELEVIERWHQLFGGTNLTRKYVDDQERESMESWELHQVEKLIAEYRQRFTDISWFMRALNEYIARQANKEDKCTGRFWEGRFKSQALLDEQALLSCMAYVDLNPIRADIAKTPESSDFTSIQMRIRAALQGKQPERLKAFDSYDIEYTALPCHLNDYLELIEFSGRAIHEGKTGHITKGTEDILTRLSIDIESWMELTQGFEYQFCHLAGREQSMRNCRQADNLSRIRGAPQAKRLLA